MKPFNLIEVFKMFEKLLKISKKLPKLNQIYVIFFTWINHTKLL